MLLVQASAFSQEGDTARQQRWASSGEDYFKEERIPDLYKRLTEAIQALNLKPDDEGKHTFIISKGNHYDLVDRAFLVYKKKAEVYAAQGRISKIVFEYYQFNMTTQVREIKTYIAAAPENADLRALAIEYDSNIGLKEKFTLADLSNPDSRRDVIRQFYSYYLSMVYRLELYRDKTTRKQSSSINRVIQLGE